MGYSFRLTARVLLYAPSHRQDNTYHGLCYTSRGALAGTRNSSMSPHHGGSIRRLPKRRKPLDGFWISSNDTRAQHAIGRLSPQTATRFGITFTLWFAFVLIDKRDRKNVSFHLQVNRKLYEVYLRT